MVKTKKLVISIIIAAILWFIMFSPWTGGKINFWYSMAISAVILTIMSFSFDKFLKQQLSFSVKSILIGVISAVVLWLIFWVGDYFSTLLFNFAKPQVNSIYGMKDGYNIVYIGLLLLFVIGPAEELFWRGYIQRTLNGKFGEWAALFISSIIYALVHIWSFNFMLIMAALVCGLFWGLLYRYHKNLLTLLISHAVWDVLVFVVFPI